MAADRMAGMEVEYGFAVLGRDPSEEDVDSRGPLLTALMREAGKSMTALPGCRDGGLFLANGGRLYVDTGRHIEWCTPETSSPDEVVRYVKAGDHLMADLARRVERRHPGVELKLFRCNVDYATGRGTWGHHESYMHRIPRHHVGPLLLSFLASRIVLCGSGGVNPRSRGVEFSVSPRSEYLVKDVSGESTNDRGLIHTRNEPLCDNRWNRLHLICGDGLCSPASLWLQSATTSLAVALGEQGLGPRGLRLQSAVNALRCFARDPWLRATADTESGQALTALEIQRRWLDAAETARGHPLMPEWAPEACARWRDTLDALERTPDDAAGGLDWRLKRVLYRAVCRDSGLTGADLRFWNRLLEKRGAALDAVFRPEGGGRLRSTSFTRVPPRGALARPFPEVRAAGRGWDELARVLRLRGQLCELELRWGEIGGNGLFDRLARAGHLPPSAREPAGVAAAVERPPERGRARLRGEAIRRLAERKDGSAWAAWDTVYDGTANQRLDLGDPFVAREVWLGCEPDLDPEIDLTGGAAALLRRRLQRLRQRAGSTLTEF